MHRWFALASLVGATAGTVAVFAAEEPTVTEVNQPAMAMHSAVRGLTLISPTSLGTCSAQVHDRYVVTGPDGLPYRTWHPQVVPVDAANPSGPTCRFGHEHGDDPATSLADPTPPLFGYAAAAGGMWEPHEGFKMFVVNRGTTNDEGRTARASTRIMAHMGTGGAPRFNLRHHSFEFDLVAPDGHEVHVQGMADTGLVGSICQRDRSLRNATSADDVGRTIVVTPGNGCDSTGSLYEIWLFKFNVGAALVHASTAVFDPITVMNPNDLTVSVRTEDAYPLFGAQRGCNREAYHGPVYWYNASGPATFHTDANGRRVAAGTPGSLEQFVSRHNDIGIPMNHDQTLMKLHRPTCGAGLSTQN